MVNRKFVEKPPMIAVQGACIDFEKEHARIMEFIGGLEWSAHAKGNVECSSTGKALGWDFFMLYFEPDFVEVLLDVYPEINKQEANTLEDCFVLWLAKMMKKKKLDYNLKLKDVPCEQTQGFRLDPDHYRNDEWMEKYR